MTISIMLINFFGSYQDEILSSFVIEQLKLIEKGKKVLDLGAGSQRFKKYCKHLEYYAQDFGKSKNSIGTNNQIEYKYGSIDYEGDCWNVNEKDGFFDAIMCTEVLEHIPYPGETIKEISRLLKPHGILILTLPCFSLRHMDPYWFSPVYSNNWINYYFEKYSLEIKSLDSIGDYRMFMISELIRTWAYKKLSGILLFPALLYYKYFYSNKKMPCELMTMGYHVVAERKA